MSREDSALRSRMIFVLGAPRSGTHWLQRIIAAHPEVAAIPAETFLFSDRGLGALFNRFHHGAVDSPVVGQVFVDREVLLDSARDLCDRVFSEHIRPGTRFLVERTPLFDDHVGLLAEVYPDALAAHIVRDGRDVARSMLGQDWGPSSADDAALLWRDAVVAGRRGRSLGRYVEIRYEQLLTVPRETISLVFEGLGLDTSDGALGLAIGEARRHLNIDPASPAVSGQKWREEMSAADVHAFEGVAGDLLVDLGYERLAGPAPDRTRGAAKGLSVESARRFARRVTTRARRRTSRGRSPRKSGIALNALLGLAHTGKLDRLPELLDPDVAVRIVSGSRRRDLNGDAGRDALIDALRGDVAMRGRQVMGDVIPGPQNVTSVLTYELEDGSRADRVLVVAARGSKMSRVSLYQLPSRPPTPGLDT